MSKSNPPARWLTPERLAVIETRYRTEPSREAIRAALRDLPGPPIPSWNAIFKWCRRRGIHPDPTVVFAGGDTSQQWLMPERLEILRATFETLRDPQDVKDAMASVDGPPIPSWKCVQRHASRYGLKRTHFAGYQGYPGRRHAKWLTQERHDLMRERFTIEPDANAMEKALRDLPGPPLPKWPSVLAIGLRLGLSRNHLSGQPESEMQATEIVHDPEPIDLDTAREWAKANRVKLPDRAAEIEGVVNAARARWGLGRWVVYRRAA